MRSDTFKFVLSIQRITPLLDGNGHDRAYDGIGVLRGQEDGELQCAINYSILAERKRTLNLPQAAN